ncbi:MAG: hypothetical protein J5762_02985 [Clostridia bacterium]|nr:hypothetical protein [Clostridia bacterium]
MNDKSSVIFGNVMDEKTVKQAEKAKNGYIKKFGDDSAKDYKLAFAPVPALDHIGVDNVVFTDGETAKFDDNALIVGNIRMGFGHYRISVAMASCARALGYHPYWLDLASFDATGSKMIRHQNDLYSKASRISQKSKLFNKFFWEPLNCEGFKKISYNAKDQKNSELLVPIFKNIPKNVPYIATHVWPSQGAIHAGLTNVVNAIPDNWPMGLHLSEGAMHAVQTPFAYLGYKTLNGFDKKPLKGIPASSLKRVGCFIDHELLVNLKEDNDLRRKRAAENKPLRILMTVGGAGAGFKQFAAMVKHLLPLVKAERVSLVINFGDHKDVFDKLVSAVGDIRCRKFFNDYEGLKAYNKSIRDGREEGVVAIYNQNIFEAVYSTNLMMPNCDLLITKPSELAYYPIPKVFMRHIGGHEVYGAIYGREVGDATWECPTEKSMNEMLDRLVDDKEIMIATCDRIDELNAQGVYNGAYECVKLATGKK